MSRTSSVLQISALALAFSLAPAFGLGLGCSSSSSGGGGGGLDCAWLAGDNCWKMTIDDAASCLPPATESGVMSADNKTCTYASGAVVTFNPALVFPITNAMVWNFTIASNGQDCLHYEDTALGFKLTVAGQTVTESSSGGLGLTVSCPDGKSYSNSNSLSLFDCNADSGASAGGIPGKATSWTDTSVSFGLIGNSSSSEAQLFNCSQP